jgi:uncharacterized protein
VQLHCPICNAALESPAEDTPETPYRPFCSQRCKLADLHNWLSGAYRISTPLDPAELDDDEFKLQS